MVFARTALQGSVCQPAGRADQSDSAQAGRDFLKIYEILSLTRVSVAALGKTLNCSSYELWKQQVDTDYSSVRRL